MRGVVITRMGQVAVDLAVLCLSLFLAFFIRFDMGLPPVMFKRLVMTLPYIVGLQFGALLLFGVRRFAWRYIGLREVTRILYALAGCLLVLLGTRFAFAALADRIPVLRAALLPVGVLLIDFAFAFLAIVGVRALRRLLVERVETANRRVESRKMVPTILVGAGAAGVLVAREISGRPDLGILPVGFVDDDRLKQHSVVHGVPVLGPTASLAELVAQHQAQQVLITMANAPGAVIREIARTCDEVGVPVKTIPGIYEIVGGRVNLSRIRPVAIEDLLGREPVVLDVDGIAAVVQDHVVVVSGAGGSIGSELCRQVCRFRPRKLVLLERAENSLFNIHRELLESDPEIEVVPIIADITDAGRVRAVFEELRPTVVLHAAAHKHVPMMEWNPGEAVKNNVFGTKNLADLASEFDVRIFVQISTDKAVRPTSVMGASKRVAEMYLQTMARRSQTRFVTVRFGNVLGSAGSVVPIFREQIARGGPVKVTHPDMRRYFMLTAEACQLVLQAASFAAGGEIFLLDMGEPVKIVDLARDMIRLSGYEPDVDINIEFSGIRPGEKLFEELFNSGEDHDRTVHPKILVGKIPSVSLGFMQRALGELEDVCDGADGEVFSVLQRITSELETASPSLVESAPVGRPVVVS
ncbi:MAG: polysaccharide biosynthesis protein [Polyangiaceae bacterium]